MAPYGATTRTICKVSLTLKSVSHLHIIADHDVHATLPVIEADWSAPGSRVHLMMVFALWSAHTSGVDSVRSTPAIIVLPFISSTCRACHHVCSIHIPRLRSVHILEPTNDNARPPPAPTLPSSLRQKQATSPAHLSHHQPAFDMRQGNLSASSSLPIRTNSPRTS